MAYTFDQEVQNSNLPQKIAQKKGGCAKKRDKEKLRGENEPKTRKGRISVRK
jgi:hypothetical protein